MESTPPHEESPFIITRRSADMKNGSSFTHESNLSASFDPPLESHNDNSMGINTWGIGWKTPLIMGWAFFLALAIAAVHVWFFYYIDGKPADGEDKVAPQSYILTASNILASLFGVCLNFALATAFCQYLWRVLRLSAMKVSTIEALFSLRSNPLLLARADAIYAAPLLFFLAVFMWGVQVAVTFPTGALKVVPTNRTSISIISAPTFNGSFMGNGSALDAQDYYLGGFILFHEVNNGNSCSVTIPPIPGNTSPLAKLATQVLITGEPLSLPSYCGVNCSYSIEFEGPWFECDSRTDVEYILPSNVSSANNLAFTVYVGSQRQDDAGNRQSHYHFDTSTYLPIAANSAEPEFYAAGGPSLSAISVGNVVVSKNTLNCILWRAKYILGIGYENNIKKLSSSAQKIDILNAGTPETQGITINGLWTNSTEPLMWDTGSIEWYRNRNILSIVDSLVQILTGNITAPVLITGPLNETAPFLSPNSNTMITNPPLGGGGNLWTYYVGWAEQILIEHFGVLPSTTNSPNLLISSSRFNNRFQEYSYAENTAQSLIINITQDSLNSLLLNTTLSVMIAYGLWSTEVNATIRNTINVFSLSRPLNIFLPYFLSLGLAVPFLIVGIVALVRNGVSATDGGFIQLLTTTTGSAALNKAAAGSCLGGDENVSKDLKELRIKFGELIKENGDPDQPEMTMIRRAGFGIEGEARNLNRDYIYGIDRSRDAI